jgi:hypothetical protein
MINLHESLSYTTDGQKILPREWSERLLFSNKSVSETEAHNDEKLYTTFKIQWQHNFGNLRSLNTNNNALT